MNCLRFYILCCVCLLLFPEFAQAASAAKRVEKAYAVIQGMRAEFSQTLFHKESGAKEERKGVLYFKKPLLVRWENTSPLPELLLVGKDAIWNVFPEDEMAHKYALSMAEDSRSLVRVITGQAQLAQDFDLEEEGTDKGFLTLRLYPKEAVQSMVEALLWIDKQSGLIKKLRVYDFYGNENEIVFTRQELDPPMKDALFTYTPPKEYIVEDRSKDAAPQKPLLQ